MDAQAIIDSLSPLVPGAAFEAAPSVDFATVYVSGEQIVAACQALRDSLTFEVLAEVTCREYFEAEERVRRKVQQALKAGSRGSVRLITPPQSFRAEAA